MKLHGEDERKSEAGEMAQLLRADDAVPEGPGSFSSTPPVQMPITPLSG